MWPFGKRKSRKPNAARFIRARFDAAVTNADNIRHWANADGLSADAAASPDIRRTLRNRSRYESANNSYARGIVLTLANDCVGTGPRLQLLTDDGATNRIVEKAFADWAAEVRLAEKLRTMRMAKSVDGEAFAVLTANAELASPVKLDIRLVEADRVTNPDRGDPQGLCREAPGHRGQGHRGRLGRDQGRAARASRIAPERTGDSRSPG